MTPTTKQSRKTSIITAQNHSPLLTILLSKATLAKSLLLVLLTTTATATANKQMVAIKGSDTMVMLVQSWTEAYPDKNSVYFQVTGGGSGTGIAALINGTTTICASSRPIKKAEVQLLKSKSGYRGMEVRVARDGLSIYTHASNPVRKLTLEQVEKIFTGEITNWKQVGGKDARIILYSRENNSGTYEFFKEHVLHKRDFAATAQHLPGTAALVNALSKDVHGIGYGGAAYAKNVKMIAIAKTAKDPYVLPTAATIASGEYPVARFLYFYLRERPTGNVKAFIDWVLSSKGQARVTELGYYPLTN